MLVEDNKDPFARFPYISDVQNICYDVGGLVFFHALPSTTRKINICGDTHYKAISNPQNLGSTTYHHQRVQARERDHRSTPYPIRYKERDARDRV